VGGAPIVITCTSEKELVFSYSSIVDDVFETRMEMNYVEGSETQTVRYEYNFAEWECVACGTIRTAEVSNDTCEIYDMSVVNEYPDFMAGIVDETVESAVPHGVKIITMGVAAILLKYTDLTIADLGFTSM
jgi:hypothetical protein